MADTGSGSVTVAAAKADVMAVIADLERYPEWSASIKQVDVIASGPDGRPATARFELDAGVLRDTYVLGYQWHDDDSVSWSLVESKIMKSQEGSYRLTESDGQTEVTYELAVDLSIPMVGMLKRKAQKAIIDTALTELKKRVEG
jgi:ribosome-associated toxin RatA of RatAB toxin-antitoxin module